MDPVVGLEILILDSDDTTRTELTSLLEQRGFVVTATSSVETAARSLREKFFSVALCDLDTPELNQGLEVVRTARKLSPATAAVVLTSRRGFETAVKAFRAGCDDVVPKDPSEADYLLSRVAELARQVRRGQDRDALIEETLEVHEEFLKNMMDLFKEYLDLKDRLEGRDKGQEDWLGPCRVLVVDPSGRVAAYLRDNLNKEKGWHVDLSQTGGEALDRATSGTYDILLMSQDLPDLPSSMVVRTIKAQAPDSTLVIYTAPDGQRPGSMELVDQNENRVPVVESLKSGKDLLAGLATLRRAHEAKTRERRYLQAFRLKYLSFLKRYANLRDRLGRLLERNDTEEL